MPESAMDKPAVYRDEHLEVDFKSGMVRLDSVALVLTRKEYELLAMLVANEGEIVPRDVLLLRVWGYGKEIRTRTLDVHIRRLRKKLAPYGDRYIQTIFGAGYRFQRYREPHSAASFSAAVASARA
ncbi:MAG: winged helix-turn-helix domain-containing protein [Bryobacterales bacterium]|nr:winged helix-turn-helix domain-containing protein [Bryobacteraceae bacterium]MDW8354758.1 winged helix-turn-helix domain-containing protein [Bryobacterales bacterium]